MYICTHTHTHICIYKHKHKSIFLTPMSKIVDKYQVALSTDSEKAVWFKHFSVEELTSYTETLPLKTRRLILSKLLSLRDFLFNLDDRNNQLAKFNH